MYISPFVRKIVHDAFIWDIHNIRPYSKAHDLLSDHHLCQVDPKLQSNHQ